MRLLTTFLLIILICLHTRMYGQQSNSLFPAPKDEGIPTFLQVSKAKWNCGYVLMDDSSNQMTLKGIGATMLKEPLFKIHGNIYYDFYYRSNIDTPYILKDYQQHTIRTYLDVTYKNNYPLRVSFTARISNAGVLKNMAGANFQFNSSQFAENIKRKLLDWTTKQQSNTKVLQSLQKQIEEERKKLQDLEPALSKSSKQQETIEEKERNWLFKNTQASRLGMPANKRIPKAKQDSLVYRIDSTHHFDSLAKHIDSAVFSKKEQYDSARQKYDSVYKQYDSIALVKKAKYDSAKQKYDSIYTKLRSLEKKYQSIADIISSSDKNVISKINSAHSNKQLADLIQDSDIPDSLLPPGYKNLLAIKSFGVGRTVIDYSELSAKNITINGVQAEFTPDNYYAVAAGIIDYRYRDLILNNRDQQKQYLTIARFGKGQVNGNNIIFTYYGGKKQLYNYVTSTNDSVHYPDFHLTGFTVEGHYKAGSTTLITAEVAKSASPSYNRTIERKSMLGSNLSFSDRSNEAYSIKINTYLPRTETKIAVTYKKIGANFQSFSLIATSSKQSLWSARVDQPFFKRQLNISASVKTNDFSNPYIDNNYYSNTVFKSIQATLRMKKMPIVSLGYFPSSQLTKLGENRYTENLFYTMTGYISHFYAYRSTKMNTFLSYTRFYNRQSDSGFVYFNAKNLMVSHSVFFTRFSLTGNGAVAVNNEYTLYTAATDAQLNVSKTFSIKGGLKYNYQTVFNNRQLGYNIGSTIKLITLGEFQFFVEKGFIPGINKQLLPNSTGRFSYFKVF